MTSSQRAVIRAIATVSALVVALGIIIVIIDANTAGETCTFYRAINEKVCVDDPVSVRGVVVAVAGLIGLAGVAVANWSMKQRESR